MSSSSSSSIGPIDRSVVTNTFSLSLRDEDFEGHPLLAEFMKASFHNIEAEEARGALALSCEKSEDHSERLLKELEARKGDFSFLYRFRIEFQQYCQKFKASPPFVVFQSELKKKLSSLQSIADWLSNTIPSEEGIFARLIKEAEENLELDSSSFLPTQKYIDHLKEEISLQSRCPNLLKKLEEEFIRALGVASGKRAYRDYWLTKNIFRQQEDGTIPEKMRGEVFRNLEKFIENMLVFIRSKQTSSSPSSEESKEERPTSSPARAKKRQREARNNAPPSKQRAPSADAIGSVEERLSEERRLIKTLKIVEATTFIRGKIYSLDDLYTLNQMLNTFETTILQKISDQPDKKSEFATLCQLVQGKKPAIPVPKELIELMTTKGIENQQQIIEKTSYLELALWRQALDCVTNVCQFRVKVGELSKEGAQKHVNSIATFSQMIREHQDGIFKAVRQKLHFSNDLTTFSSTELETLLVSFASSTEIIRYFSAYMKKADAFIPHLLYAFLKLENVPNFQRCAEKVDPKEAAVAFWDAFQEDGLEKLSLIGIIPYNPWGAEVITELSKELRRQIYLTPQRREALENQMKEWSFEQSLF